MTFQPLISVPALALFTMVGIVLCLLPLRSRRSGLIQVGRRAAMVVALAVALAGPAIPVEEENVVSNVEIVVAVDRTGSMAAEDGPDGAPRLDAVRSDLRSLVEASAGARFAIVTWDSSARLELPVTTDSSAVVHFADNLHQEVTEFSTGSSLSRPTEIIRDVLQSSAQERPENLRYLVIISDGEPTDDPESAVGWDGIIDLLDGGAVLGYGTEDGGAMRIYGVGGQGVTEEYMTVESGERAISRIDEESLQGVASELGVPLLINPTESQLRALGAEFTEHAETVLEGRTHSYTYSYLTWIPALVLSVLVAWEAGAFVTRLLALRRTHAI